MSTDVIWRPHPGSQTLALACPHYELLYHGTRGNGKTDWLLMDFAKDVDKGYGPNWRGILFRQTYKQLAEVVHKSRKWFHQIFPGARFVAGGEQGYTWTWPTGEQLLFRHMRNPADYWNYHGHEYPWIGWEELTNWPTLDCYDAMKACNRSAHPEMPRRYRANTNPYGVGHNAVKLRLIDPAPAGVPWGNGRKTVHIKGYWWENPALVENDPEYIENIRGDSNIERRKAWLEGDWDITSGGMFDDIWDRRVHVLQPFPIPASWRIDRAFDWGSARPFSVGWWAESDGTTAPNGRTYFPGTLFRIGEWYGWNGRPNEGNRMLAAQIARGIKEREAAEGWPAQRGPADTNIFDAEHGVTLADDMAGLGVHWEKADKGPGTRKIGWEKIRRMLEASKDNPMEEPGLFVFDTCGQFIRTVPPLPRKENDPDDVDTDAEDHIADETRYRVMTKRRELTVGTWAL